MSQRSPVIFWLLLAATLSVNAVVASWFAWDRRVSELYSIVAFHSLILAQLSLVCIWSTISDSRSHLIRFAPVFAAAVAALVTAMSYHPEAQFGQEFVNSFGYFGFHAALLVIAVWLLQRTKFWARHAGISRTWQFSMANLLAAMTVVAILAPFLRNGQFFAADSRWTNLVFACSSVALAVVGTMAWATRWFWLLRLAGVLGFALLLVGVVPLMYWGAGIQPTLISLIIGSIYLIQGLVLSIWLASGYIIPRSPENVSAETPSSPEPGRTA